MRILAQEEYGLRCILQLARHRGPAPLTIAAIAEAEGLSREYAGKLMQVLRRAGLVNSSRGPGGGYRLARPPSEISVWEVIDVLGGGLFPGDFCSCHPGQIKHCVHSTDCSIRALWSMIAGVVRDVLEDVALADLDRDEASMAHWLDTVPAAEGI
ncbi:MAG: Rrf2 family transcriptional regulator [Myxococcota bacterium]